MPTAAPLRILHFSHSDGPGGAGRASFELHRALQGIGCDSTMLVQRKTSNDEGVQTVPTRWPLEMWRTAQRSIPRLIPGRRHQIFNADREPGVETNAFFSRPRGSIDVIYLHWISRFLSSRLIERIADHYACPLVWVPMDAEPFTGGCHYSGKCRRFEEQCGACPVIDSHVEHDRSRTVWLNKHRHLSPLPLTFVSATSWMTNQIRRSSLFGERRIEEIALPIDTSVFSADGRAAARSAWGISASQKVILIGAQHLHDPRKGMSELVTALQRLKQLLGSDASKPQDDPLLLVVGTGHEVFGDGLPFPTRFVDRVGAKSELAAVYRCADLYVCPSLDDAGPMMIPEAMLCGTPVVAFAMGGAPDLVHNDLTGYMARLGDTEDLAHGLHRVLAAGASQLGTQARAAALLRHDPVLVAGRHVAMCESLKASA